MERTDAIEAVKRLFIAKMCAEPSVAAAIATVLFEEAQEPREPRGFSREELAAAASELTDRWGIGDAFEDAVHRELGRLPARLQEFADKELPMFGVEVISGPTRNHRRDDSPRLWLKVRYVPTAVPRAGRIGQTFEAKVEALGSEAPAEIQEALATGRYDMYEGRNPASPKQRVIVIVVSLLTAGSLLASPTARRWIMAGLRSVERWLMPAARPTSRPVPLPPPTHPPAPSRSALDLVFPNVGPEVHAIRSIGTRAYIAAGAKGLLVAEIDGGTGRLLGSYATHAFDVLVTGNTAYVAAGTAGVLVLDVEDPSAIKLLRIIPPMRTSENGTNRTGDVRALAMHGWILAAAEGIGCAFFDVSSSEPRELGTYTEFGFQIIDVALVGVTAVVLYNAGDGGGLRTIDLATASEPRNMALLATDQQPAHIAVRGTTAYISTAAGLWTVDITVPDNPSTRQRGSTPAISSIAIDGETLLMSTARGAVIARVSDPFAPEISATVIANARAAGFMNHLQCFTIGDDLHCRADTASPAR